MRLTSLVVAPSEYSCFLRDNCADLRCRITSYINNLHPQKYENLYAVIGEIISCAIPLWNLTLTPVKALFLQYHRIYYEGMSDLEAEGDNQEIIQPEPGPFQPPSVPDHMVPEFFDETTQTLKPEKAVDLRRDYGKRGLQVIVKLANIHLTPEKPNYEGGSWHVEGQLVSYVHAPRYH